MRPDAEMGVDHARGIPYETCAQLMRDDIDPSLDTPISTMGQIIKFFADHPDQWDAVHRDTALIPNAAEEALCMAAPIRAFTRYAIDDSNITGHTIPAGKRVIVMYASANRDHRKFPDPDRFAATCDVHDHLGFGQGVHMCKDMHLARREIILLIEALRRRVEKFELLAEQTNAMNNTIRAYATMPVKVHLADKIIADKPTAKAEDNPWLDVTITDPTNEASDIISLTLEPSDGIHIQVSCQSGVCGTCLTPVVDGMADHRDLVQTDLEKASNAQITVCCSRSKTKELVLDI